MLRKSYAQTPQSWRSPECFLSLSSHVIGSLLNLLGQKAPEKQLGDNIIVLAESVFQRADFQLFYEIIGILIGTWNHTSRSLTQAEYLAHMEVSLRSSAARDTRLRGNLIAIFPSGKQRPAARTQGVFLLN